MKYTIAAIGALTSVVVFAAAGYALPRAFEQTYARPADVEATSTPAWKKTFTDTRPVVEHVPLPSAVKAIYMTSCVAGTPSFRDRVVSLVRDTEINALVIDIKDFSGTLSFKPESPLWQEAWNESRCGAGDMREFIADLHKEGIFVIGRITVFQDPFYTIRHPEDAVKKASDGSVWKDHKGLSFVDVGARPYWDRVVQLAVDSYNAGFDELNFDYVRFPSDGNMQDIAFTHVKDQDKQAALETFFKYLSEEMHDEKLFEGVQHKNTGRDENIPYISADLFGMTTSNTDDLSIGQVLERALPYFDFIAPMVYPSHYPKTFLGLDNPNKHVYKVIQYAMGEGVRRTKAETTPNEGFAHTRIGTSTPALYKKPVYDIQKLRPWLQDFDYGGNYDVAEVRAQIQATYDVGLTSFMIWDPANRYTRGAYNPE